MIMLLLLMFIIAMLTIEGDNAVYGQYRNIPLEADKSYTIYYVVASYVDGTTKMAFSLTSASRDVSHSFVSTTTTTTPPPTTTTEPVVSTAPVTEADDNVLLIVGVCVAAFLLLLLLVILVVVCFYRKRKSSSAKLSTRLPTWMDVYKSKFDATATMKPSNKWSAIYELNASRFPIYDGSYSPSDLKVTAVHDHLYTFTVSTFMGFHLFMGCHLLGELRSTTYFDDSAMPSYLPPMIIRRTNSFAITIVAISHYSYYV